MAFNYPYGDTQQLNLEWFINKFHEMVAEWQTAETGISGALQAEIDRVEAAMTDLYNARDVAINAKDDAVSAKNAAAGSATAAYGSQTAAASSAAAAMTNALKSEGHAVGEQNGTPVSSGSPYYEDNSKYYAGLASQAKTSAEQDASSAAASAQHAQDLVDSLPSDYSDLLHQVGDQIEGLGTELSGAIVSFDDGAEGVPLREIAVDIEPVQDFNGQDAPYPAGARKNKWPFGDKTVTGIEIIAFSTPITVGNWTFSCEITSTTQYASAVLFKENADGTGNTVGSTSIPHISGRVSNSIVISAEANSVILYSANAWNESQGQTTTFTNIQLETGSTATDYVPYSNICPITGWTKCRIARSGKNLIDESKMYQQSASTVVLGQASIYSNRELFLKAGNYTITVNAASVCKIYLSTDYDTGGSNIGNSDTPRTFSITEDTNASIWLYLSGGVTIADVNYFMLETGSESTAYEAYKGKIYEVNWQSEAGTAYKGTLENQGTDSWTLTLKMANIASYNGETINEPWLSSMDAYSSGTTPTTGAQVVYTLTNPITYTLTDEQAITLLKGTNNVWADLGDVELNYGAYLSVLSDGLQTKANKTLIAPVLDDMVADTNLAINDLRIVNNKLYIVTAAIASGAAMVEGTNVTETTIGEQITACLNA